MTKKTIAKLPQFITGKIYKTAQTRGADDDVIYQNRVNRNSTVLIPWSAYAECRLAPDNDGIYDNGFIVLISPDEYFIDRKFNTKLKKFNLKLGVNALLYYETRSQWDRHPPDKCGLRPANSRKNPLLGEYIARIPSTTSQEKQKRNIGYTTTKMKGAGIRVYEYASQEVMKDCSIQLEYLYWLCYDSVEVSMKFGMSVSDIEERRLIIENAVERNKLNDNSILTNNRIIDKTNQTICPLCLDKLSANGFYNKVAQATGREVNDLTITQLNLFHIRELRLGEFNHRPYNLGWGHHHCNVVTKDVGIADTLKWMSETLNRNIAQGYIIE